MISAVAVGAAAGQGVLPYKVRHAAGHGVVQTAHGGDQVGIKLIFAAAQGYIGPGVAQHLQKRRYIAVGLTLCQALLQERAFELSVPNQGINQGQQLERANHIALEKPLSRGFSFGLKMPLAIAQ